MSASRWMADPMPHGSLRDQAAGLRRLYHSAPAPILGLVSNPQVAWSGVLIEHLCQGLSALGIHPLLVDAAETAPPPSEWARADLSLAVHTSPQASFSYLGARGLLRTELDAAVPGATLMQSMREAAPWASAIVLHAPAEDLLRLHGRQPWRPLLMADVSNASLVHAYGSLKRLAHRHLLPWNLLVDAARQPVMGPRLAIRLDEGARRFLSWPQHRCAVLHGPGHRDPHAQRCITDLLGEHLALLDERQPIPAAARPLH